MDCSPVVLSSLNTAGEYTSCASRGRAAPGLDHELAGGLARRWLREGDSRTVDAPPRERRVAERAAATGGAEPRLDPRHQIRHVPTEQCHADRGHPLVRDIDRDVPPVHVGCAAGRVLPWLYCPAMTHDAGEHASRCAADVDRRDVAVD